MFSLNLCLPWAAKHAFSWIVSAGEQILSSWLKAFRGYVVCGWPFWSFFFFAFIYLLLALFLYFLFSFFPDFFCFSVFILSPFIFVSLLLTCHSSLHICSGSGLPAADVVDFDECFFYFIFFKLCKHFAGEQAENDAGNMGPELKRWDWSCWYSCFWCILASPCFNSMLGFLSLFHIRQVSDLTV